MDLNKDKFRALLNDLTENPDIFMRLVKSIQDDLITFSNMSMDTQRMELIKEEFSEYLV